MALGMEVGLNPPGNFVLDGDPAPPHKDGGASLPNFRPISTVAKRLDASRWHLVWRWALARATLCYMGTELPFPKRGQSSPAPPNFRPIFIVAKRLDGSRCHLLWR